MTQKTLVDLRNNRYATIDSCDKEPIHIPGSIQPHGYLLAVTPETYLVTHCSANIESFLHQPTARVIGAPLSDLFEKSHHAMAAFMQNDTARASGTLLMEYPNGYCHLSVYRSDELYVLEFDQCADLSDDLSAARTGISELLALVQQPQGIRPLCQAMADYVQAKLEFDRVMIYRFHPDFSGEVFAEAVVTGMIPYLGLRYPAGDIPPQARELYLRNRLRIVVDVNYQPVPLLTQREAGQEPRQLDLSDSLLRSVSPIHVQYLKNMHVSASFSLSIIKDNKLWGLIACHHNSPKYVTPSQRQAALLYGLVLSSQLEVHERAESLKLVTEVDNALDGLLRTLQQEELQLDNIICTPYMKQISGATGVIAFVKGVLYRSPHTPSDEECRNLIAFLAAHTTAGTLVTRKLTDIYPEAGSYASLVSGLIYHQLTNSTDDCVIWIKPGLDQTITWAGNPEKAVERDSVTQQLTPRTSFEAWKEVVRNESDAWHTYQVNATYLFTSALQKYLHLAYLKKEEEKQRLLAEELKKSNDELENINWISAHDLKEPLRKIRVFTSKLMQMEDLSDIVLHDLSKVNSSAMRMQSLLDDIMSYARVAAREQLHTQAADLNAIVKEAVEQFAEEIAARNTRVTIASLPVIHGSTFQLKQLFVNLLGNALKFSRTGVTPEIRITYHPAHEDLLKNPSFFKIEVSDNGIGFEEQYKERIFKLFQRLETEVQGTGMGLSICRKIMENHQGKIDVSSQVGQGSTFMLYFPARLL
jgi:light-regulated signal transduction histidine kinase (bacteriophytochrome)